VKLNHAEPENQEKDKLKQYKRTIVTGALPYGNGPIHLGHLAGAYLPADIFVRYQKLRKQDIIYICGSDEHGVPITILADQQGVTPQEIVDRFHKRNKKAFADVGIDFTNYSRTSLPEHKKLSQKFFLKLKENGYLEEKTSKQFYSPAGKRFLPDRYVEGTCPHCGDENARGDQCDKCGKWIDQTTLINPRSKIDHDVPILKETRHWFLKLGDLQQKIEDWLDSKTTWKSNVKNFCKGWFNDGLRDRSVTRDLSWGVPVPVKGFENKVLYVWFDAPIGYISSTKEWAEKIGQPDRWKDYWQASDTRLIHFIGKDNIVFHAIVFPAVLMGHGEYILADEIPANEFLNLEGEKLSTSKNYAVWLEDYLQKFSPDPLRYALAVNAPETKDSDFTWKDFQAHNNNELADILGNFINRSLTFVNRNFNQVVPERGDLDSLDQEMLSKINESRESIAKHLEKFKIRKAVAEYINLARSANKYFNDQEPWVSAKQDREKCATTINICVQVCRALAVLGQPFLPFMAETLWKILQQEGDIPAQSWDDVGLLEIPAGHKIGKLKILFPKIEDKEIEPEVKRLQKILAKIKQPDHKATPGTEKEKSMEEEKTGLITFDEFMNVKLCVATIVEVEKIKRAKKLLKIQVDLGTEKRQVVAGLAEFFTPEELMGRKVVLVANLQPAKLCGVESNGMLLAAENKDGKLSLVTVDESIENGAKIR